jgi:hypothetical protein
MMINPPEEWKHATSLGNLYYLCNQIILHYPYDRR